jgi:glutaredoxin
MDIIVRFSVIMPATKLAVIKRVVLMKFILGAVRQFLGYIIVLIDLLTRGRKLKRSNENQNHVEAELSTMSLYQFYACPFCIKTRRALHKLNLPIQTRSASTGSPFRQELIDGGGKIQVPCLQIKKNGSTEWMYESSAIIEYLQQRFATVS